MANKQVISNEGERWDNIAQREYGDANRMNEIRDANPDIPTYHKLPGGLIINVPIIENNNVAADTKKMPPWKQ